MIGLLLDGTATGTTTNGGMGWIQYVMIGLIVLLLIAYPLLMSRKNKAENKKMIEQTNSLKRGDEVITNAGIYGKVLEVRQEGEAKKVVIETGNDKNKSYLTIDAYAIYSVLNKEPKEPVKADEKKVEEAKKVEVKAEKKSEEKKTESKTVAKKEKAEKTPKVDK